jgi:DNA polymerase-3 subunit delta'
MSSWDRVIGHDWAVELLRSSIVNDHLGHAHLITGPAHIGKSTLAVTFTQAINCLSGNHHGRPCGRCRACKLTEVGRYPDVIVLNPNVSRWGKKSIGIDKIRELQRSLNLTATEARYKVAIINNFESTTINAANAFLKTLEEPPSKVILLLTALSADSLLPTIPSRCRVINLRPLSRKLIFEALVERLNVPEKEAEKISRIADGRIGWALKTQSDTSILQTRQSQLTLLYDGLNSNRVGRFALADQIVKSPETIPDLLLIWLSWWRDMVLLKNDLQAVDSMSNIDQLDQIEGFAHQWTPDLAAKGLRSTQETFQYIDKNANSRLAIENLLLNYPGLT